MQINLIKLISDLLMTFTRDNRLIEMIRALTAEAETSFNYFNLQMPDWLYKAKANASIASLEHHIKRELDVDVLITNLDGKPIDFLVTIIGFGDKTLISKIIDTYGLAGRSYVFNSTDDGSNVISYTCEFINHSCAITVIDNLLTLSQDELINLSILSQFAVKSTVTISCSVNFLYEASQVVEFVIPIDSNGSNVIHFSPNRQVTSITYSDIDPIGDNYYTYILQ